MFFLSKSSKILQIFNLYLKKTFMKRYYFVILAGIISFLFSCEPSRYVPNAVNMPLLTNKSETQLNLSAGTSADVQLNYVISKKFGLMVTGMYIDNDSTTIASNTFHVKRYAFDVGAGYYKRFSNNGRLEVFTGIGYGTSDFYNRTDSTTTNYNMLKFFVQPNFGFTSEYFDMGITPRLTFVDVYNPQGTYNEFVPVIEPTGVLRIGYKNVFLTNQFGFAFPLLKDYEYIYPGLIFNVGIQIKLWKIYDKNPMYND